MAFLADSSSSKMARAPNCVLCQRALLALEKGTDLENVGDVFLYFHGVNTLNNQVIWKRSQSQFRWQRDPLTESKLLRSVGKDLLLARSFYEKLEDSNGFLREPSARKSRTR